MAYEPGITRYARKKKLERDVIANPVGPPALVQPKTPSRGPAGPVFNPTATDVARSGSLRPTRGPFSPSNPTPMTDGGGRLMTPTVTRPATPAPLPTSSMSPAPSAAAATTTTPAPVATPAPAPGTPNIMQALTASPEATPTTTPAAPTRPNVRSASDGVTSTAPMQGARSVNGRALGYGSTVNGVPTFTDADIPAMNAAFSRAPAQTGLTRVIPANDAAARANVLARTPTEDQAVAQRVAAMRSQTGGVFHMPSVDQQAMDAASDFAARDTRSSAGRAGDALYRAAQPSSFTTQDERAAAANAFAAGPGGLIGAGSRRANDQAITAAQEQGALARTAMQGESQLAQEALRGQNDVQRAIITRPVQTPTQINMEGGTLGLLGPDGIVRPALGEDGMPVRQQRGKAPTDSAAYGKMVSENINRLLGVDPVTGLMPDPTNPGQGRAPTAADLAAATQAARALTDQAFGQQAAPAAAAPPSREQFLQQARAANPGVSDAELEAYYRQTYGS